MMASDNDDKHAKHAAAQQQQQQQQSNSNTTAYLVRRVSFYIMLSTLLADFYASKAESMLHLTLWSYVLHTLYFELPLSSQASNNMILLFHGPSFSGAHALFAMYLFTLYANPNMEFDLSPQGRAVWLVYVRAFWLHFGPVLFHWMDLTSNHELLRRVYQSNKNANNKLLLLYFWASVGGYFAMGLTWEQVNGDATGTYNIENMSAETYVNVNKLIGVSACVLAFLVGTKAQLLDKK